LYFYMCLQRKKERQFKEGLYKNALTGLPNALQLHEDVEKNGTHHSGMLISFVETNEVSSVLGGSVMDSLLLTITENVRQILPPSTVLYLVEERDFFILFDQANETSLFTLAEKVLKQLNCSMEISSSCEKFQKVIISANIGIVHQVKNHRLIECSNDALIDAVELGQPWFLYRMGAGREKQLEDRYVWQNEMEQALKEDRVVPFFQPIYDNSQSKITRYEMLVRLIDKEGQVITPYFFLAAIKSTYLYKKMTCCMIEKGFSAFSKREESITLNLCKSDLLDKGTVSFLMDSIARFGLQGRVTVEVVESDWIGYQDEVLEVLRYLRSSGVCIAIDDFGSGYSNFDQLLKMEVDYLKIDGTLIKAMFINDRALSMVEAIIALANGLGVPVIPEFVENEAMLDRLTELGCKYLQGYVIGRPVPIEDLPITSIN